MKLFTVLFCIGVVLADRASTYKISARDVGGSTGKLQEVQFGDVAQERSPMSRLFIATLSKGSEHTQEAELPVKEVRAVAGSDQTSKGDPRSKRSPHRRFKGCFSCGHGGGGYYVQPYYPKPVYVETYYIKPVAYVQPVYQKPVYSYPQYSSGCSTCGGDSGSFSYSQSSASSSSYSYGYGKK
ncbi:uncharacterized protein LOC110834912 isoform X2 [Zootermopsis nevadensis]|uniref:uncharacterized protein LOC110834912 isoform X2 n=1 Tax=Zootermopsis nevadensis TaxID=136037 RepID=UPI000B8E2428|nr:uncharacterized protein LOC110834912 isoform X2 [Zootermopsis nevadensis]